MEMVYPDKRQNTELAVKILAEAFDSDIILLNAGIDKNVVRLFSPLTVTEKEIYEVIESISGTLEKNK